MSGRTWDIKQYIASGILELYVLERLEPAQMREVEVYALQHPEIRAEIDQIEQTLETFAMAAAPEVSPELLDRLLEATAKERISTPAPEQVSEKPIATSGSLLTWIAWLLAVAALAGLLYTYTQLNNRTQELKSVQEQLEQLQADCNQDQEVIRNTQQQLNDLTNPATRGVVLASTDDTSDRQAIVFYNQATNKTLFRAIKLPPPPTGKQYQLWAIDADGPKDLGVLALDLDGDVILEVDHLPAVSAFAITLEDEGGKPAPDLSALQVIGEVG